MDPMKRTIFSTSTSLVPVSYTFEYFSSNANYNNKKKNNFREIYLLKCLFLRFWPLFAKIQNRGERRVNTDYVRGPDFPDFLAKFSDFM